MISEATSGALETGVGRSGQAHPGKKRPEKSLSGEHKLALTAGRDESRAVRRYLEALSRLAGRQGSPELMARRIEAIDAQLAGAEPAVKVRLIQERMDLYAQLKASAHSPGLEELEQGFVSAAAAYSARKGISYTAWREVGVQEAVLERAGIPRKA